jgi:hypothetical protein
MIRHTGKTPRQRRHRRASAFLYGAAHAMDFAGVLAQRRGRFAEGLRGDAVALHHDWQTALNTTDEPEGHGKP